jgi:DNA/RNA-binding domain of Phe-tRNA-synthetase-like protein
MYFCHSAKIWTQFPQLVPGLLVVDQLHPQVEVDRQLQPWYEQARVRLSRSSESQMAEVAAWRRAYRQMGLKPTKYRSAAEALLRRFKREDNLPRLHPLVDLCNAVSVAFALPVAVFDLAKIDSFLEVRHATGRERYLAFSEAIEHPVPNEVIFADAANQVHARRWTFRQSRRSVISAETERALIVSEGLHETAASEVRSLIDTLATEITALWSAPQVRAILQATAPRLDFE